MVDEQWSAAMAMSTGKVSRRAVVRGVVGAGTAVFASAGWAAERARAQESTPMMGGDVAAVDAAFKEALAAGDADAIEALFAPDAVEVNPFGVFPTPAARRAFFEQFMGTNPGLKATFSDTEVVADTAVHRVMFASDSIRKAGVERIVIIHTLVVAQGKILTLTAVLDLDDPDTARFAAASQAAAGTPTGATPTP